MPKSLFSVERQRPHGDLPAVGVLFVQLGTPAAPTAKALRPYLKQFLSDPRVIELSRPLWWLILNLFVLTSRPHASAKLYAKVWTDEGSPLLVLSRQLAEGVGRRLEQTVGTPTHTVLGMTYGEPSVPAALATLRDKGCRRILVFPMYSHYSSSSTGAAFDAVMKELMTWRWVPEIRTIHQYHDDPAYIRALAATVRDLWAREGEPEMLITSYHGIPKRYFLNGDPYHCQCHKTTRLLAEELGLPEDRYLVTFQSLFGREEWLQPYTDKTLMSLPQSGVRSIDVMCPGFSVDCLETIDEIGRENRHLFLEAGGESYRFIPCLNDRPDHIELITNLIRGNLGGWVVPEREWDRDYALESAAASKALADSMVAKGVEPDAGIGQSSTAPPATASGD